MKILLLAYYFPPMGGAGVQRSLKFAKYLTQFGITPIVIAADDPNYTHDETLLNELPEQVKVYRLQHQPVMSQMLNIYRSLRTKKKGESNSDSIAHPQKNKFRDSLLRLVSGMQFPDDKAGWAKKAYQQAVEIIEREKIEVIFSTSPAVSSHCVALKLKNKFSIPWIADFRDLWTENPAYNQPFLRRVFDVRLENKVLQSADVIVAVTHEMVRLLGKNKCADDVLFLPNGYDEEDFFNIAPAVKEEGVFSIVYAGTFYGHQSPEPMLDSLRDLFARKPSLSKVLRFRMIGNVGSRFAGIIATFVAQYPNVLEQTPYLPHQEMLSQLYAADIQLLVIGGGKSGRGVLTGKIFEYLRVGRPILLIGPIGGEAAEMLERHQAGLSFEEPDIKGISIAIEQAATMTEQNLHTSDISMYDRRSHADQLGQVMYRLGRKHVK